MKFIQKTYKKFTIKLASIISCCIALSLSACAPHLGGNDYEASAVGEISSTLQGTIIATRVVKLRRDNAHQPGVGTAAGAVTGAIAGSTIGGGHKMPLVSGALGGLLGGAAGHAIENKLTEQNGIEYHIKLNTGEIITLTQGLEPKLSVGQKILVIKSNRNRSRIVPDPTYH